MNNIISGIVLISLLAPIALPVAPAIRDKISAPYSVGDAATLDDVIAASDAILLCTVTKGGSRRHRLLSVHNRGVDVRR